MLRIGDTLLSARNMFLRIFEGVGAIDGRPMRRLVEIAGLRTFGPLESCMGLMTCLTCGPMIVLRRDERASCRRQFVMR